MSQPGNPVVAGLNETGRPCPYCRFSLKEGEQIVLCPACAAPHHADCWRDNVGCAVTGCAAGPPAARTAHGEGRAGAPTRAEPAYPQGAWRASGQSPSTSQPPPPREHWSPSLAVAVIVLAVAVVGAAVALVLAKGGGGSGPRTVTSAAVTATTPPTAGTSVQGAQSPAPAQTAGGAATTQAGATTQTGTTAPPGATTQPGATTAQAQGVLPGVSDDQTRSEIQRMLLAWHEDVVAGNFSAAWDLLSRRKQAQDSREYGYATWVKNQGTLSPYLDPSGLRVSVERTDPSTGVAQVDVTGMRWSKPGSPCKEWSGITWVKYENGEWRYDPGYSTTPQREAEWKSHYAELLGGRC